MAVSSGYGYGVRQGLSGKGVANQDIGYNPSSGYVTVKGQNFMKPQKLYQGTSFTTQPDFNTAWDTFNKQQTPRTNVGAGLAAGAGAMGSGFAGTGSPSTPAKTPGVGAALTPGQGVVQGLPPTTGATGTAQAGTQPTTDTQLNDLIQMLMKQAQTPAQTDVNAIYGSPQWAAQQAQAQRGAQQGIRAAQEALGSAGFGRSTALGERAQGIQNQANEYLQTQVLPQLMAAQQQERQQQLQNQMAMLEPLMRQKSEQEQLALQRGQLTGTLYNQQEQAAQPLLNQLISLGEAFKTGTPEQQTAYRTQANQVRSQLAQMGIDPSLYDPELATQQRREAAGSLGTQTLAAKESAQQIEFQKSQQEFQQAQQEWENIFNQAQFDESKADRIWEQAFKEKDFAQSVKDAAASRGVQWASLNQRDKEFIADQAFKEKQFEYQKEQDLLGGGGAGAEEEEAASADNFNYLQDSYRGMTAEAAFADLKNNSENLTAKDYRALADWIDKNL